MKAVKIFLIGVLAALAVVLTVGMVKIMNEGWGAIFRSNESSLEVQQEEGFGEVQSSCTLKKTQEINGEDVEKVEIDCEGSPFDIIILASADDTLRLEEYYNRDLEEDKLAEISVSGKKLIIRQRVNNKIWNVGSTIKGYLKLYVPKEMYKEWEELKAVATSGNVEWFTEETEGSWQSEVENTNWEKISLCSTSGDITIGRLEAEEIHLPTVSGRLEAEQLIGETDISSTSGDLIINRVEGDLNISSVSGKLEVKELIGEGNFSTTSGDIYMKSSNLTGDQNLDSTSGEIEVWLAGDSSFELEADSVSGEVTTSFDEQLTFNKKHTQAKGTIGDDKYKIEVDTTSGDIVVQRE